MPGAKSVFVSPLAELTVIASDCSDDIPVFASFIDIRVENDPESVVYAFLRFAYDPDAASKIMSKVYLDDTRISKLVKKLVK